MFIIHCYQQLIEYERRKLCVCVCEAERESDRTLEVILLIERWTQGNMITPHTWCVPKKHCRMF